MFFNKKGETYNTVLGLVALALVAVLFLGIFTPLFGDLANKTDDSTCESWVRLQAKAKFGGIRSISSNNPCVTNIDTLKNKESSEVYADFAKKAYHCSSKYGGGNADFLSDWVAVNPFYEGTYCFVCSETTIGEDVKLKEFDLNTFELYLSQNNVPGQIIGEKKTYTDYLTEAKNSKIDFGDGKIPLKQGSKIYTIFTVLKTNVAPSLTEQVVDGFSSVFEKTLTSTTLAAVATRSIQGTVSGAIFGFVYSSTEASFGKNYAYPGLVIANTDDVTKLGCSQIHFKPNKGIIEGIKSA
ncbi:hypothetical protein HYT57_02470 [Candidatus Woesearchaeota archaeon]|nr:hypothetical protein [Candidatus Woesearchaeota archaeon]